MYDEITKLISHNVIPILFVIIIIIIVIGFIYTKYESEIKEVLELLFS